jgi:serine/threonine protein kinase
MSTEDVPPYPPEIGHWLLQDALGSGAFSVVVNSVHKETQQHCACKVVPKNRLTEVGDRARFQREINAMAFMRHESIVALHDFQSDDLNFYLFMDFCPGGELFEYIVKNGKIAEPLAAFLFEQIASAIHYSHQFGIAHRDLKPQNVLIAKFPRIKVSDFGLCGFIAPQEMMQTFCGSPCYCAPECLSRIQYDGRLADVWSLGVILYAMITGSHPWTMANTSLMLRQILKGSYTVPSSVSPKCRELIMGMMSVDVSQRLTIGQILAHPWMATAQRCKYALWAGIRQVESPESTVQQMTQESTRNATDIQDGIISPFHANAVTSERAKELTALGLSLDDAGGEADVKQSSARHVVGKSSSCLNRQVLLKAVGKRRMNSIIED